MNPYNVAVLFFAFCSFNLSLFVYLKRQDRIARIYWIFSLFVTSWGLGYAVLISQGISYGVALFFSRFCNLASLFIPPAYIHFVAVFTDKENLFIKKLIVLTYSLAIIFSFVSYSELFVPGVRPFPPFEHYTMPGPLYYAHAVIFYLEVFTGIYLLIRKVLETSSPEKRQYQGFLLATFFGYLGGGLTFLPVFEIYVPQYGIFLMPLYPMAMAYFITKEKLLDVEEFAYAAHKDKLTAMGILAASINHEIKSPLYVIQNSAETYLERKKENTFHSDSEKEAFVDTMAERIKSQAARASEIIHRLSAFAKADTIKEVTLKQIHIRDVLANILPLISYELKTSNIEFVENIPPVTSAVLADRRCLEQILFNLIINAYQAIHLQEGRKAITVTAETKEAFVEIQVSDSGSGITETQKQQIFKPFYTTKEKGSGLGLYVTKQLVEKMKGRIRVESGAGKGTRFVLELPKSVNL